MPIRSLVRPRVPVLMIMLLLLTFWARVPKAPSVLQGDFRVHDPALIKQDNSYYVFSTGKGRFLGPGGQSIYSDNGTYRLVHHYYDAFDNGIPKLQLRDLTWTSDGWPLIEQQ